ARGRELPRALPRRLRPARGASARRSRGAVSRQGLAAFLLAAAALAVSCREEIRFDDLSTGPCKTDPDCVLPSLHCNGGACVACTADAHCTAAGFPRCDMALHRCVECGVSADCGTGRVCHTGHCATPCTAGGTPCPTSAPICDDGACSQCDD